MRKNKRNTLLGAVLAIVLTVSLAACTGNQTSDQAANTADNKAAVSGTILLSVNPEIEVEYDDQGMVLEIEGVNDDGKTIVADYEGYKGKRMCRSRKRVGSEKYMKAAILKSSLTAE